jgi:stearoyl-CoA desaturase (delta-9 desaturase)
MNKKDKIVAGLLGSIHALALLAPFTCTPDALGLFFWGYLISCQGITMSYHRQLTHKSFVTPKYIEYPLAFIGVLAV